MAELDSFFAKKKDKKKKTLVKLDDVGSLLERKAKRQEEREREEAEDQKNGDGDRSQEESEWLDYEPNTNIRVDGLRIKEMGLEDTEEEGPEPVEGEKEVEKETTKTWGTVEKNETAPELIPTASEFAAAKSTRYIAPSLRGSGVGFGNKGIDLTNQEMFPTFAAAEQIEKHKKDEVKSAWTTAGPKTTETRPGAYVAPRGPAWGSSQSRDRDEAMAAARSMGASAQPVQPIRPPHPVEPELKKSANAYVPPHLRNQ
ncbi:hypothetical protein PFISCL1PPCAC_9252 [Pristionchus fissidentatus]|uniref:Protein CDV3 homolog n=1 Tax=Pristionchus fissidentatus TaxID=1538716 RepID=A0AAV5VJ52_9BILA|nr:hypothetical protein PFISCL1PPCAC_9252 [Pristionchus fissidentatus]